MIMSKNLFIILSSILVVGVFALIAFVPRNKEIENLSSQDEAPVTINGSFMGGVSDDTPMGNGPEVWGTPLDPDEIRMEDVFNSYTQDEYEVHVKVRYAAAYDKPYGGKILGYVIAEDYETDRLLHANYTDRIGLYVEDLTDLYTGNNGIHEIVSSDVDVVWIKDIDAELGIVPNPERYSDVDFGS